MVEFINAVKKMRKLQRKLQTNKSHMPRYEVIKLKQEIDDLGDEVDNIITEKNL